MSTIKLPTGAIINLNDGLDLRITNAKEHAAVEDLFDRKVTSHYNEVDEEYLDKLLRILELYEGIYMPI